jgi:hypothetical protein
MARSISLRKLANLREEKEQRFFGFRPGQPAGLIICTNDLSIDFGLRLGV